MKHTVSYLPICPIDIKHILKVKHTIKGLAELETKLFIKEVGCKEKMSEGSFLLSCALLLDLCLKRIVSRKKNLILIPLSGASRQSQLQRKSDWKIRILGLAHQGQSIPVTQLL